MNHEDIANLIEAWEPKDAELVRVIDIDDGVIERISKVGNRYWHIRFFELAGRVQVSVDLDGVDADRVIQELAERV